MPVYTFPRIPPQLVLDYCDTQYHRELYSLNVASLEVKQYLCKPTLAKRRDIPQTEA